MLSDVFFQAFLIILGLLIYYVVLKPLVPLLILKYQQGDQAVLRYVPIIGEIYYIIFGDKIDKQPLKMFQRLLRKNPNVKIILTNFLFKPYIMLVDTKLIKEFLNEQMSYSRQDLFKHDLIMKSSLPFMGGQEGKTLRSKINQYFTFENLIKRIPVMIDVSKEILNRIDQELENKIAQQYIPQDIYEILNEYTGNVLMKTFFSDCFKQDKIGSTNYITYYLYIFEQGNFKSLQIAFKNAINPIFGVKRSIFGQNAWKFFLNSAQKEIEKRRETLRNIIEQIIEERRIERQQDKPQIKFLFLDYVTISQICSLMEKEEIIQNFNCFFFAGIDTTAHLISHCLFYLAKYPKIQEDIISEIYQVVKDKNNITSSELQQLKLIQALINETLRIIPLLINLLPRQSTKTQKIGDLTIQKDWMVSVNVYIAMTDEKYHQNPLNFSIDRWLDSQNLKDPYAFIPFGSGPRNCIGQHMGQIEAKVFLIHFLQQFTVQLNEKAYSKDLEEEIKFVFMYEIAKKNPIKIMKR